MKPSLPELQAFQVIIGFCIGLGTAVIVFLVAAWSLDRKPKSKKNYGKIVNLTLDLDEHERVMSD